MCQPTRSVATADPDPDSSPCSACQLRFSNICGLLHRDGPPIGGENEWQVHGAIAARRNLKSRGEQTDRVYVICDGWAFRFAQLPDGRRQVLSILIPGDVVATIRPFDDDVRFSVQALTEVRYCGFDRLALREKLSADPALLDAWAGLFIAERRDNFGLAVDLGCRSAHERIARQLLGLHARLERRGLQAHAAGIPVPQWFIADMTGLTSDHVNRVLSDFRKSGLVGTRKASLKLLDLEGLRRVSGDAVAGKAAAV